MNIEKQTETVVTEAVTIEVTPEEAFALWELVCYLNSNWHLASNGIHTYRVQASEYAKSILTPLEQGLEANMNTNPQTPDTFDLYKD